MAARSWRRCAQISKFLLQRSQKILKVSKYEEKLQRIKEGQRYLAKHLRSGQ